MYQVDDKMLKSLDALERCPTFYSRLPIQVQYYEDPTIPSQTGDIVKNEGAIQCYVIDNFKETVLNSTLFQCYDNVGHDTYTPPSKRNLSKEEQLKYFDEVKQR